VRGRSLNDRPRKVLGFKTPREVYNVLETQASGTGKNTAA